VSARAHDDQLCLAIAGELEDAFGWRPLENLALGVDAGPLGGMESASDDATSVGHHYRQAALEERRSKQARRPSPHVHEYERDLQLGRKLTANSTAPRLADEPSTAATIGAVFTGITRVSLTSAVPADAGLRVGVARAAIADLLRRRHFA
jgi:hypothetical protein